MALPNRRLIDALRATSRRLAGGAPYAWGHQGSCNCGHLAQTLTRRSREEIHRSAIEKAGGWGEHIIDHCPTSGYPIDHIIGEMLAAGLARRDLAELENLSSRDVLDRAAPERRHLRRNDRNDAIYYMELWADLLEEEVEREEARTASRGRPVRRTLALHE